ncbi:ArsR/SmtB family transcription factor [Lignipirellula cremea]|uniref:HTH-type transcriptional repressor SmtB n=1 Tax=Lignipirellula cremea TaxID=2528010 RepID=A0A518E489_9BACT|nr:metalloregulator ArsR/SmtB family transcription factor [Lignipirellula cremea]QDU98878.1 HTH-type transcriptional repressor SmtB [Lignipirellula cremea]
MPRRLLAANKLGEYLSAIAHPRRIQIIEELRGGETDVGSLKKALKISQSNVSQHLAVLRGHRVVSERRDGRHVFYRLCSLDLAEWLLEGMRFLPEATPAVEEVRDALRDAKAAWTPSEMAKRP